MNVSNVNRSRSLMYEEKFNSENGINGTDVEDSDDEDESRDGDCDNKFVDGDVEEIKFDIELLLLILLLLVEFIAIVEGDAVDGDDVDKTDGDDDVG